MALTEEEIQKIFSSDITVIGTTGQLLKSDGSEWITTGPIENPARTNEEFQKLVDKEKEPDKDIIEEMSGDDLEKFLKDLG